jgi:hypothetical protein
VAVPTASARPRGIRVRTDLGSEADFVAAFHELCDETTIFAPTEKMKPVGAACAFSLELADGTPMVRGLGTIRNAWPMTDSPFGRPGIHIEIDQLTTSTEPIFNRLLEARTASLAKPRTRPAPSTHQLWGAPAGPPTEEMDVPAEPEEPVLHKRVTREIRGVADLTDEATPEEEIDSADRARPPTIPGAPIPIPRPRLASAPVPVVSADVDPSLDRPPRPWWMNARVGAVFAGGIVMGLLFSLIFRPDPKKVTAAAPAVAKAEPAQCPPPPEPPAALAAVAEEPAQEEVVEEPKTKARAAKAKPKQVSAKPTTAVSSTLAKATATKSTSTKPSAATTPTSKTMPGTATKTMPAKTVTTATARTAPTTAIAKTTTTAKPGTSTTAKPGTSTTAKPGTTTTAKPGTTAAKTTTTTGTTKTALTTTKPAPTTTTKAAPTKSTVATKTPTPATKTTAPTTKTTTTKPTTTTTAKTGATVATSKTPAKKPAKGGCNSLDCL